MNAAEKLTHNDIPEALQYVIAEIHDIKKILLEQKVSFGNTDPPDLLTVDQCAAFLSLQKSTIYSLIHKKKIEFIKKSKRVYFEKSKLIEYLKSENPTTESYFNEEVAIELLVKPKKKK